MNCILGLLQVFAFAWLGLGATVVPWEFTFPFFVVAFAVFIVLSAISFRASLRIGIPQRREWTFAITQMKLGAVVLHIALFIRFIFIDFSDSWHQGIGYTWALIALAIGAIALIAAAVAQMRSKTIRLSSASIGFGLAATFVTFAVFFWWAINEDFCVLYAIWGFWAIFGATKAIPRVNRFALSTKLRFYLTIHALFFWTVFNIIFYEVTDVLVLD